MFPSKKKHHARNRSVDGLPLVMEDASVIFGCPPPVPPDDETANASDHATAESVAEAAMGEEYESWGHLEIPRPEPEYQPALYGPEDYAPESGGESRHCP